MFRTNATHRALHPFPTRRSSDLTVAVQPARCSAGGMQSGAVVSSRCGSGSVVAMHCSFTVSHDSRSEEHTSELQSRENLVCRLLLEKKKHINKFDSDE